MEGEGGGKEERRSAEEMPLKEFVGDQGTVTRVRRRRSAASWIAGQKPNQTSALGRFLLETLRFTMMIRKESFINPQNHKYGSYTVTSKKGSMTIPSLRFCISLAAFPFVRKARDGKLFD